MAPLDPESREPAAGSVSQVPGPRGRSSAGLMTPRGSGPEARHSLCAATRPGSDDAPEAVAG